MQIEIMKTSDLIPYAKNAKLHSDSQVSAIAGSIREFGFNNPVLIDKDNGIIAGHGRVLAAQVLKLDEVPCIRLAHLTETQKRAYILADNRLSETGGGWNEEMLKIELGELQELDFDLSLTGFSDDGRELLPLATDEELTAKNCAGNLSDRFMIPPFSVLNAREGWWQARKRAWLALGIKSEIGRDSASNALGATFKGSAQAATLSTNTGTSIFDPVLCELIYRWFSPANAIVLDPFAGGSVRGVVAGKLGRQYIGCELRQEQVDANREQAAAICADTIPTWHCADSININNTCDGIEADLVFSCPPYADLEVYSDNVADLSTMKYADFKKAYFEIIAKSCALLKHDRFACFVVGEVRDKKGNYYNFVGDTIEAFRTAGLEFYNEAILVTPVGTVGMQTSRNFPIGRKLGKVHQNILVFVKGDGKKAAEACGVIETDEQMFAGLENDNT